MSSVVATGRRMKGSEMLLTVALPRRALERSRRDLRRGSGRA